MAQYSFETDEIYKQLEEDFIQRNGRSPNDLDRLSLLDQVKLAEIRHMREQFNRIEGLLMDRAFKVA